MPIRLLCICGHETELPLAQAGERVTCPECGVALRIPTTREDMGLMRWYCSCGQRLKARAKSAGREIKCPSCGMAVVVPMPSLLEP